MDATLITALQCLCVAFVALLYAAVGHGGATGYIALLSLFGLQHEEIATTALILNTVVASISLTNYYRAGCFQLKQALPYLILSIPLAYIGARPNTGSLAFCRSPQHKRQQREDKQQQ